MPPCSFPERAMAATIVHHTPEGPDIRARVHAASIELFGSHVGDCADEGARRSVDCGGSPPVSGARSFAMPKSSSFAPVLVSITFAGFKSR